MKINIKIIILLLSIATLILGGCHLLQAPEQPKIKTYIPKRDILIVGLKGDIFGFSPNITSYESTTLGVNFNIFNGLVEFDDKLRITSALAESWSNPNELTWRFNLRKGVVFHSGHSFTAEDVKYTIENILSDEKSAVRDLITNIDKVNVIDDYTVEILTKKSSPILLNRLTDIFIISKAYQTSTTTNKIPNGTGAYKYKTYVPASYLELELNQNYWKGAKNRIKKIMYRIINDDQERINALLTKKIDFAEYIPPEKLGELKEYKNIMIKLISGSRVIFLGMDFREKNAFGYPDGKNPTSDLRVRKAIYQAIDENRIANELMEGLGDPATQFVTPEIFGYNPEIERLPYNIENAKTLLKEAGYENGFTITMDCPNDRYMKDEAICHEIKEQLKTVNINVELNIQPKAVYFEKLLARESSFYLLGWGSDTADGNEIFDYLLHTVNEEKGFGKYNCNSYSNPLIDAIGEKAAEMLNAKDRLALLKSGFKMAMDEVAIIPLHRQKLIYGLVPDVVWFPRADERTKLEDIQLK